MVRAGDSSGQKGGARQDEVSAWAPELWRTRWGNKRFLLYGVGMSSVRYRTGGREYERLACGLQLAAAAKSKYRLTKNEGGFGTRPAESASDLCPCNAIDSEDWNAEPAV